MFTTQVLAMSKFLLISGSPGTGKSTIVQKLIQDLTKGEKPAKLQGFYTEEVRNSAGYRIGFDVVTLDGQREILARENDVKNIKAPEDGRVHKVGKYIVYVREFEETCKKLMESTDQSSILVIDEIGKMELLSKRFEVFIKNLLKSPNPLKVIATVPLKSQSSLIDQIKQYPETELFIITKMNRDVIYENVLQSAKKLLS